MPPSNSPRCFREFIDAPNNGPLTERRVFSDHGARDQMLTKLPYPAPEGIKYTAWWHREDNLTRLRTGVRNANGQPVGDFDERFFNTASTLKQMQEVVPPELGPGREVLVEWKLPAIAGDLPTILDTHVILNPNAAPPIQAGDNLNSLNIAQLKTLAKTDNIANVPKNIMPDDLILMIRDHRQRKKESELVTVPST
jgi:hypothetical protein